MAPAFSPNRVDPALLSLLAFWADAGVDTVALDAPIDRLDAGARRRASPTPPPRVAEAASAPARPGMGENDGEPARRAAEAAASAPSLAALAETVAAFDFGRLARGAPVFARGSESPLVIVLGDEPCPDDGEAPFTGRAGALLDRMLVAAGLEGAAWIANVSAFRSGGDRAASAARQAACRPFLERAVALGRPRAVLALGGDAAAWAGLGGAILTARGRWGELAQSGIPTLATFHPAFLLDHPEAKKRAWADLMSLTARIAVL